MQEIMFGLEPPNELETKLYSEDWEEYQLGYDDFAVTTATKSTKTCRTCNKGGLHWGKNESGSWRLFDHDNSMHTCDFTSIDRKLEEPKYTGSVKYKPFVVLIAKKALTAIKHAEESKFEIRLSTDDAIIMAENEVAEEAKLWYTMPVVIDFTKYRNDVRNLVFEKRKLKV